MNGYQIWAIIWVVWAAFFINLFRWVTTNKEKFWGPLVLITAILLFFSIFVPIETNYEDITKDSVISYVQLNNDIIVVFKYDGHFKTLLIDDVNKVVDLKVLERSDISLFQLNMTPENLNTFLIEGKYLKEFIK